MTSTACDDQFAPEPTSTGWVITLAEVEAYAMGRADERAEIVALLLKHGYRQIADAIKAGQHRQQAPA